MKILAFSDVHGDLNYLKEVYRKSKKENPDIIICAGDMLNFWEYNNKIKNSLDNFDKKILLIHGNHEDEKLINKLCSKNIINIHKKIFEFNGLNFVGYGGGGFEQEDKRFERFINKIKDKLKKWILVTHAPPFNTHLDLVFDRHVGSKSIRESIEKFNPELNICGHLHENFNIRDKIKSTRIINPGPSGEILKL
ncbi:MAG: Metallophosphoesterase [archaeon GW2011_AR20]|nr:MAG: Metallophosphoesterase [archaeon GW2011_AR20]MBS3160685.1 metallophosphoesterase [Candidatus Woesearchaeota archaeon]